MAEHATGSIDYITCRECPGLSVVGREQELLR